MAVPKLRSSTRQAEKLKKEEEERKQKMEFFAAETEPTGTKRGRGKLIQFKVEKF